MEPTGRLSVRSKIWIEDEQGKVVFGAGRLRILEAVERTGSILAASKELQMSYRAVWGKIRATEQRLGRPLLTKKIGGTKGGGSELTGFAKALVQRYRTLQALTESAADRLFEDVFTPNMTDNPTSGS
ncbi:MAG: LysR family transcriptional regulator [Desulfacinum sp.]|jgi:molybdate transport system regulatory protein|nr:LysR family transcriptional regulator [Desulfacinum sp.]MBZ4660020.1 LysR family transcriptional regulator [Desulfacinum sp.]